MPVPTALLVVDADIAEQSPKGYDRQQLRDIALAADDVYRRLAAATPHAELLALSTSADPHERLTGETYGHLFGTRAHAQGISADYDGGILHVASGNHRVRAAAEAGVAYLPVDVHARSAEELDGLRETWRVADASRFPSLQAAHDRVTAAAARTRTDPDLERSPSRSATR